MAKPVIKNSDMGPELSEKALRIASEAVDIEYSVKKPFVLL